MTQLEQFRKETKEWLDQNCPPSSRGFTLLGDTQRVTQALVRMSTELSTPCVLGPEFAKVLPSNCLRTLGVFLLEESATPRELFEPVNGMSS